MSDVPTRPCSECGRPLQVGPKGGGKRRCVECGTRAGIKASQELRAKSGPAYTKWRAAMRRFARS